MKVSVELKTGSPQKNFTLALDWGKWSTSHPSHFTLRERTPGTQWTVVRVGPWAHLNIRREEKHEDLQSVQILLPICKSESKMSYFTTQLIQHSGIEIRINTANTIAWQWTWLWATYIWLHLLLISPSKGCHHNFDISDHTKTHIKH